MHYLINCYITGFLVSVFFFLSGCSNQPDSLRVYFAQHERTELIKEKFNFLKSETNIEVIPHGNLKERERPIDLLSQRDIDLTVVANSSPYKPNIEMVLPVYRGLLHVLIRKDLEVNINDKFLENKNIYIRDGTTAVQDFLKFFVNFRKIDHSSLTIAQEFNPEKTEVVIIFSPRLEKWQFLENYRLISFGEVDQLGRGSYAESLSFHLPMLKPVIIPANSYVGLSGNEQPVLTLSVDMLLVTHNQVDNRIIQNLAQSLIENRNELSADFPSIFYSISDQFDELDFQYPLHAGARNYIERNSPTFLERYAETINVLVYLFVLSITAVIAILRWRDQKRKDRIDKYYERLFEIREKLRQSTTDDHQDYLESLYQIEREAFQLLIDEKVASDDSFNIFLTLLHTTTELAEQKSVPEPPGKK